MVDKIDFLDANFLTTSPDKLDFLNKHNCKSYFIPNPTDPSFETLNNFDNNTKKMLDSITKVKKDFIVLISNKCIK